MVTAARSPLAPASFVAASLLAASLAAGAALAAPAPVPSGGGEGPVRPNIVLFLADDFGYECVRANGGESYATPNLDRLAREGVLFRHCYSQPLCTPTRVQLMTGLYNQRNYVRFAHLDPGAVTFAQILRSAGYRTCVAGKWQLAGGPDAPRRFGFDEHLLWQLTTRRRRYANPVLERDGRVIEHSGGEYGPDLIASFACDFIRRHVRRHVRRHRDKPFLVYCPMILTHAPFEPTPVSAGWDPKARGAEGQSDRRHFPDMVAYADAVVGRVLATLGELGLREKTLVIFTGDNGTGKAIVSRLGGREVRGGKGETTGAGTHVPLIASWPGTVPAGRVSSDLVDSTDFFPTLLEAAGVPAPEGLALDGRSFLPQLRGERGQPREWSYSWFSRDGGPAGVESARTQRFKLYGDGRFFDVEADPGEARDLSKLSKEALELEAASARERLARALEGFRGTRRLAVEPARPRGDPERAAKRVEDLGGRVFRKDGRIVEVVLNRRDVPDEALRLIGELEDLTDLSLEETSVGDAGAGHLAALEKLEWLNLYRTRIGDEGLAHLSRISSLKLLPIGETRVTDAGLVHLKRMGRLEYLGLRGNKVTDRGLEHLARLAGLKGLHLGATAVTDAGAARLAGLGKLEKLWLDGTAITDVAVEHLAKLTGLKELHVAGTRLTAQGIEALRAALPGCAVEAGQ
ncbi:MAG: sulfatase-like hydrolase/transferase [Planctomycetes bacterium]|nr:sulfatase-like hydrolase/transferase [Planctomycetota bacterium]